MVDASYSRTLFSLSLNMTSQNVCSSSPDSVYHKIFECQSYSSNEEIVDLRSQLTSLKELEVNFHLRIFFSDDLRFRKIFFNLVQLICRESKFKDEYLVKNDDSNE